MVSKPALRGLLRSVDYLVENRIPGDFVQSGVWRGGSSFLVAARLKERGSTERHLWLFDTFSGMVPPTNRDVRFDGRPASIVLDEEAYLGEDSYHWASAREEVVRDVMQKSGYPDERVHLVAGDVLETLESHAPERVALAYLDTDWFASTSEELRVLVPRMVRGGIVIVDDYNYWQGSRSAVDEYFEKAGIKPLLRSHGRWDKHWIVS